MENKVFRVEADSERIVVFRNGIEALVIPNGQKNRITSQSILECLDFEVGVPLEIEEFDEEKCTGANSKPAKLFYDLFKEIIQGINKIAQQIEIPQPQHPLLEDADNIQ